jgi:hypothetical protein
MIYIRLLVAALALALGACGPETMSSAPSTPSTVDQDREIQDMWGQPQLEPVKPGTYFMDPDLDPTTPLRVVFELSADGWSQWAGAVKFADEGHVAVSVTTVRNIVSDGCLDHSHADPEIGPTVDDLATALADLAPFQVTSPPEVVSAHGYDGMHLELTVPNLPVEPSAEGGRFTECTGGQLKSWVAPWDIDQGDGFYGYTGSGYTEEFWILDVDGTRLMIAAERSPGSPPEDLQELNAILDSVRIEG